jgi:uncharacterized protein with HEPN domain
MPSKSSDPQKRLLHIRDNIYLARTFVDGIAYEAFRDNQLVLYAVTRALEIISEASRRLPDDMKARHPDLPWNERRDRGCYLGSRSRKARGACEDNRRLR